jgi:peptidoglycan/xylan/chitin deacetylase (PgdA/CDA1 family)
MSRISILMYHQVGDFAPMKTHRAGYCHHRSFARQMAVLRLLGYEVIGLDAAVAGLAGEAPLPRRAVVLTFDDGYQNFYDYAWPVLKRHGFPATVFLVSDRIGDTTRWLTGDGRGDTPLMDAAHIRELHRQGVLFGAHSATHPRLSKIEPERMREEVARSKLALESLLNESVDYFCYPYGDYDHAVMAAVRQNGFRAALTCMRGDAAPGGDPLQLPRKAISFGDSLLGYFWKLEGKRKLKGNPLPSV